MALLEGSYSPRSATTTISHEVAIVEGTSLSAENKSISPNTPEHETDSEQISLYVVHQGDTLPAIAKMFGVSVNTIRWSNDIKGNTLTVGETLVILPVSGVKHTVKSGDTLLSIAKKYKGDIDDVLRFNNLTLESKLSVGDIVVVPDGEITATVSVGTKTNNTGVGTKGSNTPSYSGYYMRPLVGGIKSQGLHGHNGVDIAASFGTNILAAAAGEVIVSRNSGWNGGYGSYVVIKHNNGTQTLYAHLSATNVSAGDHVAQGQVIGAMGRTGKSTGVHLHFEIRGAKNPF